MTGGRPRLPVGTHGSISTRRTGGRVIARTRVRDLDGSIREVRATAASAAAARALLLERIRERPSLPSAGVLRPTSPFGDLADLRQSFDTTGELAVRGRTGAHDAVATLGPY